MTDERISPREQVATIRTNKGKITLRLKLAATILGIYIALLTAAGSMFLGGVRSPFLVDHCRLRLAAVPIQHLRG